MNENINLIEILKDCPKNTIFYSSIFGDVTVCIIEENANYPIAIYKSDINEHSFFCRLTKEGKYSAQFDGECILFPSKDQRDWSKFTAPWYKKDRFNPKTLEPFTKVLVKDLSPNRWNIGIFSHYIEDDIFPYKCVGNSYKICIPYNNDTKHLVGTTDEAPEYYKYWEN